MSTCVYSQYVYVISVIWLLFVQTTQIFQFTVINVLDIFFWGGGEIFSNLSPISSNVSPVRTSTVDFPILYGACFFESLLACLLIVFGLGTGRPGNFTRNLHCV